MRGSSTRLGTKKTASHLARKAQPGWAARKSRWALGGCRACRVLSTAKVRKKPASEEGNAMALAANARRSAESAATTPPSESAVRAPPPICARTPLGGCASALHWGASLTRRARPGGKGRAATGDRGKRCERLGCGASRATIAPVAHAEEITSKARSIGVEGTGCAPGVLATKCLRAVLARLASGPRGRS